MLLSFIQKTRKNSFILFILLIGQLDLGGRSFTLPPGVSFKPNPEVPIFPANNNDKPPDCFHGSNKVRMESGEQKLISDVMVGDSVLAVDEEGILRFSKVIMQLHQSPEVTTNFHVIRTKTGRNLTISPRHLIYKAENDKPYMDSEKLASYKPVFANRVKKGDFVFVLNEDNEMMKDEVVTSELEAQKGIFAPVTVHGNIIVEDILASCYAEYEDHSLIHMGFAPFRWVADMKNKLSNIKTKGIDASPQPEQENFKLHWYAESLISVAANLVPERIFCN